ncbi:MAG: response regulator [Planctomycetaceae bacterium]|nr:response regulator [Planctomycetaceae bacterium]
MATATQRRTVLVVDDEPALRELLTDALDCEDYHVITAASGKEALSAAAAEPPDLIVADLNLGDCTGLDVLDALDAALPAVVITGRRDAAALTEASRRRPVEIMSKPLDIERLRRTVSAALAQKDSQSRTRRRSIRLRRLARHTNLQRKSITRQLETTCAELTTAYRSLSSRMARQQMVIEYQSELIQSRTDDDVFRSLFKLIVGQSGGVFGAAMVCDGSAELQIAGRFGVPVPDGFNFCSKLARPIIEAVLAEPACQVIDAGARADEFDPSIRTYLPGLTVLAVPLIPAAGEMIGLVVLYRKGEQPFTDDDIALAEMIALPTALAVRGNE